MELLILAALGYYFATSARQTLQFVPSTTGDAPKPTDNQAAKNAASLQQAFPNLNKYAGRLLTSAETAKLTAALDRSFTPRKWDFATGTICCLTLSSMIQLPKNHSFYTYPKGKKGTMKAPSQGIVSMLLWVTAINNESDRNGYFWQPMIHRNPTPNKLEQGADMIGNATRKIVKGSIGKVLSLFGIKIDEWTGEQKAAVQNNINAGLSQVNSELSTL